MSSYEQSITFEQSFEIDYVSYLDKIQKIIKLAKSTNTWLNTNDKIDFDTLVKFVQYLFDCLHNPLKFRFRNTQQIDEEFKLKYTELFKTNVEWLQEKLSFIKETNKVCVNNTSFDNIENVIQLCFTTPIIEKLRDNQWLISIMREYPNLFVF